MGFLIGVSRAIDWLNDRLGKFANWKKSEELTSAEGRAEILLTPGAFLRISENTKVLPGPLGPEVGG